LKNSNPGVSPLPYPVINAARQVIVFIAGEAKAEIVRDITAGSVNGITGTTACPKQAITTGLWITAAAAK